MRELTPMVLQVCAVVRNPDGMLAVYQGAEATRLAYSQLTLRPDAPEGRK